jgi:hypothetical protein
MKDIKQKEYPGVECACRRGVETSGGLLHDHETSNSVKGLHNETNVMYFSFSLLRIKSLYMFRALLAHPQEALHKQHLVCCVRIMSVKLQPCHSQLTLYARNIPNVVCVTPPEDEEVMLETGRGL